MPRNTLPRVMKQYFPTGRRNHVRPLDFWMRETGTGQQVAQFHERLMMMMMMMNKSQPDALFIKFIFDKELYMFRTDPLSIIRSLNTVYAPIHVSYAECLQADSQHN